MIRDVNFYISPNRIKAMNDGTGHPFFSRAQTAFESLGMRVRYIEDTDANRRDSIFLDAYAMFYFKDSFHDHALDVRHTPIGPFYRMEKEADRALYRLVDRPFAPDELPRQQANSFFKIWQRLLIPDTIVAQSGAVLIPLQGKLLQRRSQQTMSPLEMLKATIKHDPSRPIWLKLHPKETYSDAEMRALAELCDERVKLIDIDLDTALKGCDYIVTQNSSVLLHGLFYRRPAIVFADCEYHHPFQSVRRGIPLDQAFARVTEDLPDFAKFAYWYLQLNCINTSREWAEEMIIAQCREFGWNI
jgi:hypothetical protein